jgi:sarcosine oxidase delta subunit
MEALRQPQLPGKEGAMKCPVCEREASEEFCVYHSAANERVRAAYPLWVRAYGEIEWKGYLDSVKRNPQTGQWAKEIAEFLRGS